MIKPGFFANDELAELPMATRMLFAGLWTIADREGRLEDRPKRIKGELFRYDDLDIDSMLNALQDKGFVVRYEADGQQCIEIVNFLKHQRPHNNEVPSVLPPREKALSTLVESRITKDGSASALNVDISLEPLTQNLDHNPPTVDTRANGKSTDVSPKIPKKPLPMNGTAQQIVAAFCLCAGIQEPAVYAKAVGQAQQLAKAGVTAADIPDLFAAANWSDSGVDLGKMPQRGGPLALREALPGKDART